ncbi:hypothetical protein CEUSTIGMA_g10302.t1 [Chlamydomonas eustigma]|uniref:Uncharacterized protein n=1 Tax=Chlamydomonas eustigma TaxID=1157962 RepID=A0A250XIN3_9CHLO|nr:hypothetical protein CEUSTIGMA_g10302.t1 [Chlamydomonas eustigma]|eukprot:GAX82876.1 hypothetical protein CEUSTIGMA_g10302.t1 [Chlamydomonas eustigma]
MFDASKRAQHHTSTCIPVTPRSVLPRNDAALSSSPTDITTLKSCIRAAPHHICSPAAFVEQTQSAASIYDSPRHEFKVEENGMHALVHDTPELRGAFLHYCHSNVRPLEMKLVTDGPFMTAQQFSEMAQDLALVEPEGPLPLIMLGITFATSKNDQDDGLSYTCFLDSLLEMAFECRRNVAEELQTLYIKRIKMKGGQLQKPEAAWKSQRVSRLCRGVGNNVTFNPHTEATLPRQQHTLDDFLDDRKESAKIENVKMPLNDRGYESFGNTAAYQMSQSQIQLSPQLPAAPSLLAADSISVKSPEYQTQHNLHHELSIPHYLVSHHGYHSESERFSLPSSKAGVKRLVGLMRARSSMRTSRFSWSGTQSCDGKPVMQAPLEMTSPFSSSWLSAPNMRRSSPGLQQHEAVSRLQQRIQFFAEAPISDTGYFKQNKCRVATAHPISSSTPSITGMYISEDRHCTASASGIMRGQTAVAGQNPKSEHGCILESSGHNQAWMPALSRRLQSEAGATRPLRPSTSMHARLHMSPMLSVLCAEDMSDDGEPALPTESAQHGNLIEATHGQGADGRFSDKVHLNTSRVLAGEVSHGEHVDARMHSLKSCNKATGSQRQRQRLRRPVTAHASPSPIQIASGQGYSGAQPSSVGNVQSFHARRGHPPDCLQQRIVPYDGGDVPYDGGDVPYDGGGVPYDGGGVPYDGGDWGLPPQLTEQDLIHPDFVDGLSVEPCCESQNCKDSVSAEHASYNDTKEDRSGLNGRSINIPHDSAEVDEQCVSREQVCDSRETAAILVVAKTAEVTKVKVAPRCVDKEKPGSFSKKRGMENRLSILNTAKTAAAEQVAAPKLLKRDQLKDAELGGTGETILNASKVADIKQVVAPPPKVADKVADIKQVVTPPLKVPVKVADIKQVVAPPPKVVDQVADIKQVVTPPHKSMEKVGQRKDLELRDSIKGVALLNVSHMAPIQDAAPKPPNNPVARRSCSASRHMCRDTTIEATAFGKKAWPAPLADMVPYSLVPSIRNKHEGQRVESVVDSRAQKLAPGSGPDWQF